MESPSLSANKVTKMRVLEVRSRGFAALLATVAMGVAGCSMMDSRPDAEIVKDRAQARWNALVAGDFSKAYGYISPTGRSALTPDAYASSLRRGFWRSVTVDRVDCSSKELCEVQTTIEYEGRGMRTRTPSKEKWVKDGSTWWFVQQ